MKYDLEHFVDAQEEEGYERVVGQLRRGRKTTHWMWFVFPQLGGLGSSSTSKRFAIRSLDEAAAYLQHSILGPRLLECARILAAIEGRSAVEIFGPVDSMKLRSSMTLFLRAAPSEPIFREVLERYYSGEPDAATDQLLAQA